MRNMEPVTPGEVLLEDFLKPMGISQYRLAKAIKVPASRIHDVVHGKRAINAELALRLARFFGTDAQSWVNLQAHYDLECAETELAARVKKEVKPHAA
jgi:antitoxin HigA-1